jgi:hypothetical protein
MKETIEAPDSSLYHYLKSTRDATKKGHKVICRNNTLSDHEKGVLKLWIEGTIVESFNLDVYNTVVVDLHGCTVYHAGVLATRTGNTGNLEDLIKKKVYTIAGALRIPGRDCSFTWAPMSSLEAHTTRWCFRRFRLIRYGGKHFFELVCTNFLSNVWFHDSVKTLFQSDSARVKSQGNLHSGMRAAQLDTSPGKQVMLIRDQGSGIAVVGGTGAVVGAGGDGGGGGSDGGVNLIHQTPGAAAPAPAKWRRHWSHR